MKYWRKLVDEWKRGWFERLTTTGYRLVKAMKNIKIVWHVALANHAIARYFTLLRSYFNFHKVCQKSSCPWKCHPISQVQRKNDKLFTFRSPLMLDSYHFWRLTNWSTKNSVNIRLIHPTKHLGTIFFSSPPREKLIDLTHQHHPDKLQTLNKMATNIGVPADEPHQIFDTILTLDFG